jgi:hypothetical protein
MYTFELPGCTYCTYVNKVKSGLPPPWGWLPGGSNGADYQLSSCQVTATVRALLGISLNLPPSHPPTGIRMVKYSCMISTDLEVGEGSGQVGGGGGRFLGMV